MPRAALQRRATQRLPTDIEVGVHTESNFYAGFSANVSEGGIFVATYRRHEIGDRLRVTLRLPGVDDPIEAKVEVRWLRSVAPDAEGVPGFGAAFVELAEDAHAVIERFVGHREPLFYDD
ncbi:MAG: TIGR02266 family protein [Deltaproteobacteria bacterium]|nr:TIGR02266 family protein [Deltaproteobacteria bacterium]